MKKECVYCGLRWGVSILQKTPKSGYECPRCATKRKRAQQRQLQKLITKTS